MHATHDNPDAVSINYPQNNISMKYVLEEMWNNPGSLGVGLQSGAARWALDRIEYLEKIIEANKFCKCP